MSKSKITVDDIKPVYDKGAEMFNGELSHNNGVIFYSYYALYDDDGWFECWLVDVGFRHRHEPDKTVDIIYSSVMEKPEARVAEMAEQMRLAQDGRFDEQE